MLRDPSTLVRLDSIEVPEIVKSGFMPLSTTAALAPMLEIVLAAVVT